MKRLLPWFLSLAFLVLAVGGCGPAPSPTATPAPPTATPLPSMELTSAAFGPEEITPEQFTCDGAGISPPLAWGDPPPGTRSFALIVYNPDARSVVGTAAVHWLLFNLPAESRGLPEGIPSDAELAGGGRHGQNSEQWLGYIGPCPPFTQRYFFTLYALDTVLDLDVGITRKELLPAMEGHILAQGELMGKYSRKS
jgi:Raf kinase inhibitor-like YbhB/YbcL family protein